jgi:predicted AlkP superfamily phosphohydrolase/phosphomutase
VYRQVNGDAPDLMVYFDDLHWRSAGTLGHPTLLLDENDTGPDDAVHGWNGIFVLADPARPAGAAIAQQSILDVTPTLLSLLGLPIPDHVQGRPIAAALGAPPGATEAPSGTGEARPPVPAPRAGGSRGGRRGWLSRRRP